jgi:polar amino acid transport system substrate-binding protein
MLFRYREDTPAAVGKVALREPRAAAPVGIGFVGAGSYAQGFLLPNVPKSADYALKGILTASGAGSRSAAERFGFEYCATDEKEIFGDEALNTVFVTTRHDTHAGYTVRGLQAGKNVYVEKPLCLTREELGEIGEAHGSAPGSPLVMVGFNRRFSSLSRELRASFGETPLAMSYRVNAGPVPADHWVLDPGSGGGRLVGEVCHFIDYLTFLNGSLPTSVHAAAMRDGEERNDTVSVTLTFANGSLGTVVYCTNSSRAVPKERVEISSAGITAVLRDFRELEVYGKKREAKRKLASQDKGQKAMVASFLEAVRTGGEAPISFGEIVAVTEATFAAAESLRTGERVRVG